MKQQTKNAGSVKKRTERYGIVVSPLYGIKSHARLAEILRWMGTPSELRAFVRRSDNYTRYIDKSKPGKDRPIEAPATRLKHFQSRLLDVLRRVELPDYLHSARPGFSYLTNSAAHRDAIGSTVTMDIDSFYQSVTVERVALLFERKLNCASDVAMTLANLLCCDKHIATGSPASPLVSFWAYRDLFDSINERVRSRGGIFTLYIDDMGITGNGFGHTDARWVGHLIHRSGLRLKNSKTRVFGADAAKLVTGRAFRNGVSRAPNKQHRKMRDAETLLQKYPSDGSLRASVTGLKRHLALLDDKKRDQHRAEAARVSKSS